MVNEKMHRLLNKCTTHLKLRMTPDDLAGIIREKLDIDSVVNKNSDTYNGGLLAGTVMSYSVYGKAASFAIAGREIKLGKNLKIAPFGNRTGHPTGAWPHYHRRNKIPENRQVERDQGFKRHRPWDSRETDKSFWDKL